jgi:hypothetical protein
MQRLDQCGIAGAIAVCRPALDHLFEILYPHGDVEPIENVLTAVTKAELGKPYGIPAVRQEGDRLTGLHTFLLQEVPHTIGRSALQLVHVAKAMAGILIP